MNETIESTFRVEINTKKQFCLYDMNRGLYVFIEPIENPNYTSKLRKTIGKLESGDIINAVLESQNKLRTKWIFTEIQIE